MWIWCVFPAQIDFTSSKKPSDNELFRFERLWDSKPLSRSKNREKLNKIFKNLKILVFLNNFGVKLMLFSSTNCFYLFKEDSRTTMFFLLNVFDILSHQVFRKIDKNCMNFLKIWDFKYFCQFRSKFNAFFPAKIAFISLKKPLGQRIFLFLNVFDILSHEVIRKIDKNCMKFSKVWSFWDFCHFRSEYEAFLQIKLHLRLRRRLLGKSFLVECF